MYSVTVMEIVNGVGFDSIPAWSALLPDNEQSNIYPAACMSDFDVFKGEDLYECIEKCRAQILKSCIKECT